MPDQDASPSPASPVPSDQPGVPPNGDGQQPKQDTGNQSISVDLGGAALNLPPHLAKEVISYRDQNKQQLAALQQQAADATAKLAEIEQAKQEAEQQKEQEKLLERGEFDKALQAREMEWRKTTEEKVQAKDKLIQKIASNAIDTTLTNAIMSVEGIDTSDTKLVSDIKQVMQSAVRFNTETLEAEVVGPDGYPMTHEGNKVTLEQFAKQFLEERPYFLKKSVAKTPGGAERTGVEGDKSSAYREDLRRLIGG